MAHAKQRLERLGRTAQPRQLSDRPERGEQGGPARRLAAASASTSSGCSSPTSWASTRTSRCPAASSPRRSTARSCSTARRSRGSCGSRSRTCCSSPISAPSASFPYEDEGGRVARLLCDIYTPDEQPFAGCPRMTLKRQLERAKKLGFAMMAGCEAEFFLFEQAPEGSPTHHHARLGVLFRPRPARQGRGDPAGHRRAAGGDGVRGRGRAPRGGARASTRSTSSTPTRWSPRTTSPPSSSSCATSPTATATSRRSCPSRSRASTAAGCTRTSRCSAGRTTRSTTPRASTSSPRSALSYIEGLLQHARGFCAITNPLINSYKRLVPGYEAPSNVAWSTRNRSPLVRIPDRRGLGTRCELRMPDPVVQSVPRAHRAARGRPRRRRAQARGPRAGAPEHLHA